MSPPAHAKQLFSPRIHLCVPRISSSDQQGCSPGRPAVMITDAADSHAIVMVALRDKGLREVSTDPELVVLRMLCDRRDELSRARVQALNRMHRLFLGLLPGGAPVKKSVRQYQVLLATIRPRDLAGKTRRRMAAEELEDLHRLDAKPRA